MNISKPFSFYYRSGWTKEALMEKYAMTEGQYLKVLECLNRIQKETNSNK